MFQKALLLLTYSKTNAKLRHFSDICKYMVQIIAFFCNFIAILYYISLLLGIVRPKN